MRDSDVSGLIVDAAIEVHRHLGPGLLESVYQKCLAYELLQRGLEVECEKLVPVRYKDVLLDCDLRIDLLVNRIVVVETKTVEALAPLPKAVVLLPLATAPSPNFSLFVPVPGLVTSPLRMLLPTTVRGVTVVARLYSAVISDALRTLFSRKTSSIVPSNSSWGPAPMTKSGEAGVSALLLTLMWPTNELLR